MQDISIVPDDFLEDSSNTSSKSTRNVTRVTIELKKPFEVEGRTYTSFGFRAAEAGDLMDAESVQGQFTKTVFILARMADVPLELFRLLPVVELNHIVAKAAPLLGESPKRKTGSTS